MTNPALENSDRGHIHFSVEMALPLCLACARGLSRVKISAIRLVQTLRNFDPATNPTLLCNFRATRCFSSPVFNFPEYTNEPILTFAPGSEERENVVKVNASILKCYM